MAFYQHTLFLLEDVARVVEAQKRRNLRHAVVSVKDADVLALEILACLASGQCFQQSQTLLGGGHVGRASQLPGLHLPLELLKGGIVGDPPCRRAPFERRLHDQKHDVLE